MKLISYTYSVAILSAILLLSSILGVAVAPIETHDVSQAEAPRYGGTLVFQG